MCREGCLNNPLMVAQMLHFDYGGHGRCDLVIGKGHDLDSIDRLEGPVVVAGHCAVEEVGARLRGRLGKDHVFFSSGCNCLHETTIGLARYMGVNVMRLVPTKPLRSLWLLMLAHLHGSTSTVPSVKDILKQYKVKY